MEKVWWFCVQCLRRAEHRLYGELLICQDCGKNTHVRVGFGESEKKTAKRLRTLAGDQPVGGYEE